MKYIYLLFTFILFHGWGYGQVTLPIDFEGGVVDAADFTDFDGAQTSIVANTLSGGINTSQTIARLIKNPGGIYAGTLILPTNLDFSINPIIRMKVYTDALANTRITMKTEACTGCASSADIHAFTTVSGEWEVLTFDFTGQPNHPRLVFFFNSFNMGDGSDQSTFYFDDIEQPGILDGYELALPIDFEGNDFANNPISDDNFGTIGGGYFDGSITFNGVNSGAATVETNTPSSGNLSNTVGQIIRHAGSTNAGAYIDLPEALVLDLDPIICMNVFTEAVVGTEIILRIEDSGNSSIFMQDTALTTVSGGWDTLCFVFHNAPPTCDRLTFLFDLGNPGNGLAASTFLFDDIYQPLTPSNSSFFFTPGSQFFCPPSSFTFTYPGDGDYKWFDENGDVVATGPDFTTPLLGGTTPFFVQDTASAPIPITDVGPTTKGEVFRVSPTASMFFTSNIDNGSWYGVDIVQAIFGPTGDSCVYNITGHNLTLETSENRRLAFFNPAPNGPNPDNVQRPFTFPSPVVMNLGDTMELTATVSGLGCFLSSFTGYDNTPTPYPASTSGGEIVFIGYEAPSVPAIEDDRWMGFDYRISGDVLNDPTIYQVNAIADCGNPLPIELLDFSVRERDGDALLVWSTASELNNDRFELLRSIDGLDYKTIGVVNGAGNSSTVLNYTFLDREPLQGVSYYKLKQVDFDGEESTSDPVPFLNEANEGFRLFPNPTASELTLTFSEDYERIEVLVYGISGSMVNHLSFSALENVNFKLNGNPGMYFVEVRANNERKATFHVMKY